MIYPQYETMTHDQWLATIAHDHQNPARTGAYVAIANYLEGKGKKILAELGYCSCYDFTTQFREWHDNGTVQYVGYDTCPQFASYAQAEFPGYDFRLGSSENMEPCHISYAKHVFTTMAPELMAPVLSNLLMATQEFSVINWHYPPSTNHYKQHIVGERNVWTNRYDRDEVMGIYDAHGFNIETQKFGQDELYLARRRE